MKKINVLVEIITEIDSAFEMHLAALTSESEAERQADDIVQDLAGFGLEYDEEMTPIPLFTLTDGPPTGLAIETFSATEVASDQPALSTVIPCTVNSERLADLEQRDGVRVWPNSEISLIDGEFFESTDTARSDGGLDCRPFREGVPISTIRHLLGVESIWRSGFRGQNIIVGIIDEGVNGEEYPVIGGFSRPNAGRRPGTAPITSHGSMCAADVLIAAPWARLFDYPFLGVPRSGGAIQMFQSLLEQRRIDGTPHLPSEGRLSRTKYNRWNH